MLVAGVLCSPCDETEPPSCGWDAIFIEDLPEPFCCFTDHPGINRDAVGCSRDVAARLTLAFKSPQPQVKEDITANLVKHGVFQSSSSPCHINGIVSAQ